MSASLQPVYSAREAVEALEAVGYQLSVSGYTRWRWLWPRTVKYSLPYELDIRDVSGDDPIGDEWGQAQDNAMGIAEGVDMFPYLRERQKLRRKLRWAQALLAHCPEGTRAHVVIHAVVKRLDAALHTLSDGGAQ